MDAVQLRRWTRQEYDRMVEAGILGPDDHVELIEGEIVEVSPQKPVHSGCVQLAQEALRSAFGHGFIIRAQLPLALDDSEPEPDLAVVPGSIRDYLAAHPATAVLVVEVADATLDYDRRHKGRVYARAGIPDYWVVNLVDRVIEVYREPRPDGSYALARQVGDNDSLAPLAAPSAPIAVSALLP